MKVETQKTKKWQIKNIFINKYQNIDFSFVSQHHVYNHSYAYVYDAINHR